MKKLILFFIFCFFILPLSAKTSTITLWHAYRGLEETALQEVAENFNRSQTDYKVELLSVPYDAFANKLTSAIPRGNGPDMFIFAHERIGDWARSGIIESLDPDSVKLMKNRVVETTLKAVKYKNKYWGFPLSFKSLVLFYRTDMMASPPAMTKDLILTAKKFTDKSKGKYGLAFQATDVYFSAPFLYGFKGGFCLNTSEANDKTPACIDNPGNIKAVQYIADLVNKYKIVPEEATSSLVTQLFNDGKVPMVINGPWFMGEIGKKVPYNIALLPTISETGEVMKPFLTVESLIIANHEKTKVKGVKTFAEYITSTQAGKIRALKGRQAVATKEVYKDEDVSADKFLNIFRQQAEIAVPMSNLPGMRMVWEPMATAMRKAIRGADTSEHALSSAMNQYTIFSKTPPEGSDPFIYIIILLLFAIVGLVYAVRQIRKNAVMKSMKKMPAPYLYVFPAMFAMVLLVFIPFAVGTCVAFTAHRAGEYQFVGFANFISILFAQDFPITNPLSFYFTLAVTVLWTSVNVFLHVTIGLFFALLLREPWLKLKGIYRVLLIIPWAVPNYITALIWKGMFNRQFGAINGLLIGLGLEPVSWFSSFWTSFAANVTTNTWLGFPFMMITALGALQAIPRELEDAAAVDGANMFQRFWNVTLPLLKPALLPAVILGSVWTFNMFNIIYLVSGGEPDGGTEILISEAYKWAFQRQERYGYAAAYATLIFIVLLVYSKTTEKLGKGK